MHHRPNIAHTPYKNQMTQKEREKNHYRGEESAALDMV
jgi:hypothetical protein